VRWKDRSTEWFDTYSFIFILSYTSYIFYICTLLYSYTTGELVDGVSGGSLSGATAARAAVCAIAEQSPDAGDLVRRLVSTAL
jgi:hypothetical protein